MKGRDESPGAKTRETDLKQGAGRPDKEEKLMRERSIKTNRRQKFIECLSSSDVNISMHTATFSGVESYITPQVSSERLLGQVYPVIFVQWHGNFF